MLEFIIWFITCFFSILGFVYLYAKYTDSKNFISKKFIFFFIIFDLFLTIINYYSISFVNSISYFLVCPLLFYLIHYSDLKKLIYYILIIWFYAIVFDLIIMAFLSILHSFIEFDIYGYVFESVLTIFIFLMLFLLAHSKKIKCFTNNLYEKILKIKYFDFSLILFALFTFLIGIIISVNLHHLNISILLILLIILMIIVFVILLKYRINAIENEIFLKTLKENNDFYIQMENENRIFRHNLNAKLLSIKSVSNRKAIILLNELLNENNHNVNFSNNIKVVPYGFNGIIYEKIYHYINDLDIKINNNIDCDIFDVLKPRRYNVLVEKTVIALDNAIEACLKSNKKILVISLINEGNNITIEINNTFSDDINVEELGNVGYSTKGAKRGLGLFSSIRNNEASLSVKIINDIFISKITAKKNILKKNTK